MKTMKVNDFLDYRMQKTAASKAQLRGANETIRRIMSLPVEQRSAQRPILKDAQLLIKKHNAGKKAGRILGDSRIVKQPRSKKLLYNEANRESQLGRGFKQEMNRPPASFGAYLGLDSTKMQKTARAERVGEAAILTLGRLGGKKGVQAFIPVADRYNKLRLFPVNKKRVAKYTESMLKKEIPGTKGVYLPGMNKRRVDKLAKKIGEGAGYTAVQLSHPETAVQLIVPGSPIHMPITSALKRKMMGLEDVSLKHKVKGKIRRAGEAIDRNKKGVKRMAAAGAGGAITGLAASEAMKKKASVEYRGKTFPGYGKPIPSDRKNKKKMVLVKRGDKVKVVHFGHKGYEDFTQHKDKKRRKNYLTRSAGIKNKSGQLTKNDPFSPNYWARRELW